MSCENVCFLIESKNQQTFQIDSSYMVIMRHQLNSKMDLVSFRCWSSVDVLHSSINYVTILRQIEIMIDIENVKCDQTKACYRSERSNDYQGANHDSIKWFVPRAQYKKKQQHKTSCWRTLSKHCSHCIEHIILQIGLQQKHNETTMKPICYNTVYKT